jgi:hypothetical protein
MIVMLCNCFCGMHCDRTGKPNHHSALRTDGNPDDDPRSTKTRGIRIILELTASFYLASWFPFLYVRFCLGDSARSQFIKSAQELTVVDDEYKIMSCIFSTISASSILLGLWDSPLLLYSAISPLLHHQLRCALESDNVMIYVRQIFHALPPYHYTCIPSDC